MKTREIYSVEISGNRSMNRRKRYGILTLLLGNHKTSHLFLVLGAVVVLLIICIKQIRFGSLFWNGQRPAFEFLTSQGFKCNITNSLNASTFYSYLMPTAKKCNQMIRLGGHIGTALRNTDEHFPDGYKFVCEDGTVAPRKGQCITYSFGINNEWSFDDAMAEYGCKVFSFDPTMDKSPHRRSEHIQFFDIGLSNFTGKMSIMNKERKVFRLVDIRKKLGHESEILDYLKMDIEGSELETFEDLWLNDPQILSKYITQIAMEIHPGKFLESRLEIVSRYWRLFQILECLGFELVHVEKNNLSNTRFMWEETIQSCCYEMLWVNRNTRLQK